MKSIVLCADDYSQNEAISRGIIDLISKQRLSATSCLTTTEYWPEHAQWLLSYKDDIDIGLHFNLTLGKGGPYKSLPKLILAAYLGTLKFNDVITALNLQLDNFITAIGRNPDFIDGHQHIHQLPIIRECLLTVYSQRLNNKKCYLRYTGNQPNTLKKWVIFLLGSHQFKQRLNDFSIPHNTTFSGIYNFSKNYSYANHFPSFLTEIKNHGLIMCHPGLKKDDQDDPIAYSRNVEYQYLISDQFIIACQQANVKLGRVVA